VVDIAPVGVVARMREMSAEARVGGECARDVRGQRRDGDFVGSRVTSITTAREIVAAR
jgi:hypothetical protein